MLQVGWGDGDELTFARTGPTGLGKPLDGFVPEDVLFSALDGMDIGLKIIVFTDRNLLSELLVVAIVTELVLLRKSGAVHVLHQLPEGLVLGGFIAVATGVQLSEQGAVVS